MIPTQGRGWLRLQTSDGLTKYSTRKYKDQKAYKLCQLKSQHNTKMQALKIARKAQLMTALLCWQLSTPCMSGLPQSFLTPGGRCQRCVCSMFKKVPRLLQYKYIGTRLVGSHIGTDECRHANAQITLSKLTIIIMPLKLQAVSILRTYHTNYIID